MSLDVVDFCIYTVGSGRIITKVKTVPKSKIMKLSVGFFAGLAAADVAEPVKSLQRLTGFAEEIFNSGAFDHKSVHWRSNWARKFYNNAGRMRSNVSRKCGFYDADIHTFDYEYDTGNACNGIKMIIDGFSRWSENHLSRCNGQKNRKHHQKRFDKWNGIFAEVLDCEEDKTNSYTFVIPADDWYMYSDYDYGEMGEELEFSTNCNPDFKDTDGDNCDYYINEGYCDGSAQFYIRYSNVNEHGILENGLNCPQCGCGADGPVNLNDVYAEKGRKLSVKKN